MTRRRRFVAAFLGIVALGLTAAAGIAARRQYHASIQRTREATLRTDLFRMRDAIDQYHRDKARYPASLIELVDSGYIRRVPEDPITNSSATWRVVTAGGAGPIEVHDVKSGASGRALDGTTYADW